jgi:hypothetical protein
MVKSKLRNRLKRKSIILNTPPKVLPKIITESRNNQMKICSCSDSYIVKSGIDWSLKEKCFNCIKFREQIEIPITIKDELTINIVSNKDCRLKDYWEI